MDIAVGTPRTIMGSRAADEKAVWEELIVPVEPQMMRTIWRIVRHDQIAEDTLQNALAIIWRKLSRVRKHPNPQALILKICLDCACDSLRRAQRQRRLMESAPFIAAPAQRNNAAALDLDIERRQVVDEVLQAIGRLPRKQASAVLMRVVQDQPYDVIAKAIGCGETTARIHVSRGRKRLSKELAHLRSPEGKES